MATTVLCNIVSAEKQIFSEQVEAVIATGSIGELGIYPGHTPLLTGVKPGPVKLKKADGTEEIFFASGGYLEVQPNSITILADTALRADDIDEAAAQAAQQKAEQELADAKADIDFGRVQSDIQEMAAMLRTVRKYRQK